MIYYMHVDIHVGALTVGWSLHDWKLMNRNSCLAECGSRNWLYSLAFVQAGEMVTFVYARIQKTPQLTSFGFRGTKHTNSWVQSWWEVGRFSKSLTRHLHAWGRYCLDNMTHHKHTHYLATKLLNWFDQRWGCWTVGGLFLKHVMHDHPNTVGGLWLGGYIHVGQWRKKLITIGILLVPPCYAQIRLS